MSRLLSAALAASIFAVPLAAQVPDVVPVQKDPRRHLGFLEDIQKKNGKIDVVFLGDSITDGWRGTGGKIWDKEFAKFNPINLGISGDRTQHVLWRIQHGELAGYKPKAFVIMIGTNNLGTGSSPENTAAGVKAILDEINKQHPAAKLLLLGIFPRDAKPGDRMRQQVAMTNAYLEKLAGGNVKFKDIGKAFLAEGDILQKEIMPDFLHLSEKGYQIWADSIKKEIAEMVK